MSETDFENTVNFFYEGLYRFAYSLTGNSDDAAELTQETFARFLAKHRQIRDNGKIKSWLSSTLYRTFLGWKRKETRHPHVELSLVEDELPALSPATLDKLESEFVNEVLLQIEERYRVPVALYYFETALPVPRNLKANLLALQKLERPMPWWLNLFKLTAATAMMIALMVFVCILFARPHEKSLDAFRQAMTLCSLQHHDHVTFEVNDWSKIQNWLQGNGGTTNFDLPPEIQAVGVQGCKVIGWNNQKVTMICFFSKEKGEHLDLFVLNNPNGSLLPKAQAPQFVRKNGLMTAAWSRNDNFYLLTGENAQAVRDAMQSI